MQLSLTLTMPVAELEPFLRLLRAWEAGRPEIAVQLACTVPELSTAAMADLLRTLDPPLPYILVVPPTMA